MVRCCQDHINMKKPETCFPDLKLIASADLVKTICPEYSEAAYQVRNQWMVDRSSKCIAVYNGTAGGTRNTIQYARKNKVFVKYLKG